MSSSARSRPRDRECPRGAPGLQQKGRTMNSMNSEFVEDTALNKRSPAKPGAAEALQPVTEKTAVPDNSDAAILARAQAGDHVAFAQLYATHKRRVYSLCLRMLSNVAEAEDLTQESFLQLHRKIATFRGDSRRYSGTTTWWNHCRAKVSNASGSTANLRITARKS